MSLPDLKQLDKLIQLCRKRGITTVKIDNIELTLAPQAPVSQYKKAKGVKSPHHIPSFGPDPAPESDGWESLSEEERLFFSVRDDEQKVG